MGSGPYAEKEERILNRKAANIEIGKVVSWRSEQGKYWLATRTVRKFAEDLSLSDYQEVAKVHSDSRQREHFKAVVRWMKKQGANADVRLGSLL
jgi:hypothetical protein